MQYCNKNNEKGVAFVELAIVISFFCIILVPGFIEVGNMITDYQKLTGIVREGVRLAGKTSSMEPGYSQWEYQEIALVPTEIQSHIGPDGSSTNTMGEGHWQAKNRILQLMFLTLKGDPLDRDIVVKSSFVPRDCVSLPAGDLKNDCVGGSAGTVNMSVEISHLPLFLGWASNVKIAAARKGPHLF